MVAPAMMVGCLCSPATVDYHRRGVFVVILQHERVETTLTSKVDSSNISKWSSPSVGPSKRPSALHLLKRREVCAKDLSVLYLQLGASCLELCLLGVNVIVSIEWWLPSCLRDISIPR